MTVETRLQEELQRLARERSELERQIATAREEIARSEREKVRLEKQLASLQETTRELARRCADAEQHNSELTNLCVASTRLHESLDRREVLSAIQEIVINLVGSEELAVFEVNAEGTALELVDSFGVEPGRLERIPLTAGKPLLGDDRVTACVPLMLGDKTVGAVAVFRLLPQKAGLEPIDHDLLELLRAQAGVALFCTRALQKPAGTP